MLRALENAERSKSGWTWTPHHQYRNVWHGNHKEFAALVEKPWGGYWEWRVWKVRTAKEIASGLDETKQEAFRDVEKAARKRTRFLFNEKSKWKHVGGAEYVRSFYGFALAVGYGKVFHRYYWAIHRYGEPHAAAEGSSDTFPGAKKAAEEMALSRRTLFNPLLVPARWWVGLRDTGLWELQKARSPMRFAWLNVVGPFSNKADAVTEMRRRNYLYRGVREKKPRTLFNLMVRKYKYRWYPAKGAFWADVKPYYLQVKYASATHDWDWWVFHEGSDRHLGYGDATSIPEAKRRAEAALDRLVKVKPRTLFNTVRR